MAVTEKRRQSRRECGDRRSGRTIIRCGASNEKQAEHNSKANRHRDSLQNPTAILLVQFVCCALVAALVDRRQRRLCSPPNAQMVAPLGNRIDSICATSGDFGRNIDRQSRKLGESATLAFERRRFIETSQRW
jgi:hypothetical protein